MDNGTEQQQPPTMREWRRVKRVNTHRTSAEFTDKALKAAQDAVKSQRGREPVVDTLIYAAVRLAMRRDLRELLDEVRAIETGEYPDNPHEAGG